MTRVFFERGVLKFNIMSKHFSSELDPFRVIMSAASETDSSDIFIETFNGGGLTFEVVLTGRDDSSHATRIRNLTPRVLQAYEGLSQEAGLAARNAVAGKFLTRMQKLNHVPVYKGLYQRTLDELKKVGWGFQDGRLFAVDTEVREMFFPKGSQWDAFVVIREIIDKAQNNLMLVDPFCDGAFFGILGSSSARPKEVQLLCRNKPDALKAEAKAFGAQHGINIELRTSFDFHDRFLLVDDASCIHLGASINHAGSKAFMISAVEDSENRNALIKALGAAWKAGVLVN